MNERWYPGLAAVWVLAAVVAVASTVGRGEHEAEMETGALPLLPPGARSPASFETDETLPSALAGVARYRGCELAAVLVVTDVLNRSHTWEGTRTAQFREGVRWAAALAAEVFL